MSRTSPAVVTCPNNAIRATALRLLQKQAAGTLLCRTNSGEDMTAVLNNVDCIFSDVDGTLTLEGATVLPNRAIEYLGRLRDAGVSVVLVSGKPHEEIASLLQTLPLELHVSALYEKGAYRSDVDATGQWSNTYLLGTPELEQTAAALRRRMPEIWRNIQNGHIERISFGWAGSGKHHSLLSIDVFTGDVPERYELLTGVDRDRQKLKDAGLLSRIEAELRAYVDTHCPGWIVVHLGNANFEIAPPGMEKDIAVRQTSEFKKARSILVLGDSGNDRSMFALRQKPKVVSGLVLHSPAAAELAEVVDFITFGMANPYPLFDCVLAAKAHTD